MSENAERANADRPWRAAGSDELALLVEAVQDYAIFLLGIDGEIRSWNRGAERLMGYTPDEAIGANFSLFYGPDDLASAKPRRELDTAIAAGRVEDEGWRLRKDGQRFWANTVITALRSKDDELLGFAQVTRDLTDRREMEEELRQSEEIFRLLVGSVRDYAIFLLDPDGCVTTWNEGARRIKQYEASDIIGKHFSTFYSPEDQWKPPYELEVARREGRVEDEGWRVRKDGSKFWANVVITAVHDASGRLRGFAKVTRDITDRRDAEQTRLALLEQREARLQAEEEKRRAEAAFQSAQDANRAKDEFLMTLSHELRTPMTAILGWARLLPTLTPGDKLFNEAVAAIGRSARLQAKLIDDVLDVSRIVSGKLRLTLGTHEIVPVLHASIDSVRASADAKGISIHTSFDPNLGSATFDPTRLQQIVWNLLSNAVKFTPKGGLIELRAKFSVSELQISVKDTGEGIEQGFLPHVFEPFRQAESPTTRVHGGLGLGLSIVRYLAEAHGGTVTAESDGKGHGSRFTLCIPVRGIRVSADGEEPHEQEQEEVLPPGKVLTGRRIIVVDDDLESRDVIAAVLRQAGAEVSSFEFGAEAVEAAAKEPPDVILTDIAMPEMDGYTLRRQMRARHELDGVPIVALTAYPASVANDDFEVYLRKPIDPFELVEQLRGLLPN